MRIIGGAIIAAVALAAVGAEGGARVELPLDGGWSGSVSGDDGTVRSDGDNALEVVCEHPLRKMINYLCMIPRSRCGFVGCQQASRLALSAS